MLTISVRNVVLACLLCAVAMPLSRAVADDASHPFLPDVPANRNWHAPASRHEAVYTGQGADAPKLALSRESLSAGPLNIDIYSDANAVTVTRGDTSFEFPIAPNRRNQLVLDANDELPRIVLNGQELMRHQGAWIRAALQSEGDTVDLTFNRGTWCNLSLSQEQTQQVQRVVLKRRDEADQLRNSVLPNEYIPHSSAPETDTTPIVEPLTPSGAYERILMSPRNRTAIESRGLTTLAAAEPTEPESPDTSRRVVTPGMVAPPATTRPLIGEDALTWRIDLTAGVTAYSAVYYHGIMQENQDSILQINADGLLTIWHDEAGSFVNRITFETGLRSSHFSGPSGGRRATSNAKLVELNVYGGVGVEFLDRWYIAVRPRQRIRTAGNTPTLARDVHSVELELAFDDSTPAYSWSLQPHLLVLHEYEGQSDRVRKPGDEGTTLVELGLTPQVELFHLSPTRPVMLRVPMRLGLSIDDYYQDPRTLDDDTFGYFEIGADVDVPLFSVASDDGMRSFNVRVTAGVHAIFVGDALQQINIRGGGSGNDIEIVGMLGVAMDY